MADQLKIKSFFVAVLLMCFCQVVAGQEPDEQTTQLLERVRQKHGLVGLVCCVVKDGKIVALGAVGNRKLGSDKKITVDDKLHLGSCTKAMTATLVAQLVAEKKLGWDTRLLDVFPNLEEDIHPDYHRVTMLDLLTHQAGCPKNNLSGWPRSKPVRTLRYDLIRSSFKPKPENEVGEFFYSNLGYITAGAMLEKIANKNWEDLIEEKLFVPLGMKSAGFGPPGMRRSGKRTIANTKKVDQPWGHYQDEDEQWIATVKDNPPILGPAGTVHCTIKDWARFVSLHVSWVHRKPKILDAKTLAFLQTPQSKAENACGWFAVNRRWGDGRVISHNGSNTFWMANVWASPRKDLAVLTVANCCSEESSAQLDEVAVAMINRFAR